MVAATTNSLAIGIDLGTSNSCMAIVRAGDVQILNDGVRPVEASVVSVLEDGSLLIGNQAKERRAIFPSRTIASSKRLVGRFFFSEEVQQARKHSAVPLIEGANHSVHYQIDERLLSPTDIAAHVLVHMKERAERLLNYPVQNIVITVPAYFNDHQRQATRQAAIQAGLVPIKIINEPTAAALAYGFGRGKQQRVVVYDLGGGTFDVSILQIADDIFEVLSTSGDSFLGGDDFDACLSEYLMGLLEERFGAEVRESQQIAAMVASAAESSKNQLSQREEVKVVLRGLLVDGSKEPAQFETILFRKHFASLSRSLVQKTLKVCDEAMQSARLTKDAIDGVILVGGPTRLPFVRQAVSYYFGQEPIDGIDPDAVVAMGAAIHAAALEGRVEDAMLLDVTPLSLRIATVDGFTEVVIPKNTPVPFERRRIFTTSQDNQEHVSIVVFQGEEREGQKCEQLGAFTFSGLRRAPRGEVSIEVCFEVNANGIVQVTARDCETDKEASVSLGLDLDSVPQQRGQFKNSIVELSGQ